MEELDRLRLLVLAVRFAMYKLVGVRFIRSDLIAFGKAPVSVSVLLTTSLHLLGMEFCRIARM